MPRWILLLCLSFMPLDKPGAEDSRSCHYQTYQWNTITRKADNIRTVSRPYSQLAPDEIDPQTGCTVCEEDQAELVIDGIPPVRVCKYVLQQFQFALREAVDSGFDINQLVGYRVGKTRGDVDINGRRTLFSHHAYGTALDVNPGSNGLYTNCLDFNEQCLLVRGGPWKPDGSNGSIRHDGVLVQSMKSAGFRWGGEIAGRQKDFMHFSLSGY